MIFGIEPNNLMVALMGGILPALLWLSFWLREDRVRPEPRGRIALTFFIGMVIVFAVIPMEQFFQDLWGPELSLKLIIVWSFIEEFMKFVAVYFVALHSRDMNEPIDGVIYLITVALGFAALENTLFMLSPLGEGLLVESIVVSNMRFIGATLLHTLASGIIGVFIAFSYYRSNRIKKRFVLLGIILATILHALFNFFIIERTQEGIFVVFGAVWIAVIGLLLVFEKIKRIHPYFARSKN